MPFTFAHPAITVPLHKKFYNKFDFTALVLGTMAPDFEYFIRFQALGEMGHTPLGFIYLNLPLVFILAYLWHTSVKKPFILSMPTILRNKLCYNVDEKYSINSIKTFFIFVSSALIGMVTHVFWDSFTHGSGFFVELIPILRSTINIFGKEVLVYKILQHGSTLLGFLLIFIYMFFRKNKNKTNEVKIKTIPRVMYCLGSFTIASLITAYRALFTLKYVSIHNYGIYIVSFISGSIIGVIIMSLLFQILRVYEFGGYYVEGDN